MGPSVTGSQIVSAGLWGDTSLASGPTFPASHAGVLGTADDAGGGIFLNNSPSAFYALYALSYDSNGRLFAAENISNNTNCAIDAGGNLSCTGTITPFFPLDGGRRKVGMSAIESPENWFEDFGSAQLVNGVAVVRLDPNFMQTVNTEKNYRVFPVPNGDCKGLYMINETANSFEVHELSGGISNISFDYRITAIRRKYETVRFADHTNDPDPAKMLDQMQRTKPELSSSPVSVGPVSLARIPAGPK